MVGGRVVETVPFTRDGERRIWINVRGTRSEHRQTLGIYVADSPAARSVSEGDSIWWQGSHAMWTPRVGGFNDYRLDRIGYSGVSRPEPDELLTPTPGGPHA